MMSKIITTLKKYYSLKNLLSLLLLLITILSSLIDWNSFSTYFSSDIHLNSEELIKESQSEETLDDEKEENEKNKILEFLEKNKNLLVVGSFIIIFLFSSHIDPTTLKIIMVFLGLQNGDVPSDVDIGPMKDDLSSLPEMHPLEDDLDDLSSVQSEETDDGLSKNDGPSLPNAPETPSNSSGEESNSDSDSSSEKPNSGNDDIFEKEANDTELEEYENAKGKYDLGYRKN